MTRLILVRHGESKAAVLGMITSARTCTGLSELGLRQAEALATRWSTQPPLNVDVLVSSTYLRAIETAAVLGPILGLGIEQIAEFGEHDPGVEVEGMTYAKFSADHPDFHWNDDPYIGSFPGGETTAQFRLRIGQALGRVLRDHAGKTIVIVCHGGVVDSVFRRLMNSPISGLFQLFTLNTAVCEFELTDRGDWRLVRYNDTAHLDGLPAATLTPHHPD
jgi:2,3-bisphosphoglycerate-dependent phosphoglycerate mutase